MALRIAFSLCLLAGLFWLSLPWQVFVPGLVIGAMLATGRFGFAGGYIALIAKGEAKGIIGSMLLVLCVSLLVLPLTMGSIADIDIGQFTRPIGLALIAGAGLFGIGMSLANTCSSGAIRRFASFETDALAVVIGLVGGGFWASFHFDFWSNAAAFSPLTFNHRGLLFAAAVNIVIVGVLIGLLAKITRKPLVTLIPSAQQLLLNVVFAVFVALAAIAINTPWAVAVIFPTVGAEVSNLLAIDFELDFMSYWTQPGRDEVLINGWLSDRFVQLNLAIIVGAALYALLVLRRSYQRVPLLRLLSALIGGSAMGYGALISYGCNIGAFVGGISSASMHGWVWIVAALIGVAIAETLKKQFRFSRD